MRRTLAGDHRKELTQQVSERQRAFLIDALVTCKRSINDIFRPVNVVVIEPRFLGHIRANQSPAHTHYIPPGAGINHPGDLARARPWLAAPSVCGHKCLIVPRSVDRAVPRLGPTSRLISSEPTPFAVSVTTGASAVGRGRNISSPPAA